MVMNNKKIDWLLDYRHPIFLVGLLLFFILPDLSEKIFLYSIEPQLIFIILVLTSTLLIHAAPRKRIFSYIPVAVLVLFLFLWYNYSDVPGIEKVAYILLFIYFSSITYFLFQDLMHSTRINGFVIIGAFTGYFLMGVIFFFIFAFVDLAYPDTVSVDITSDSGGDDMLYFSFITLTTIGYGDFAPTSGLGQKIAIVEGLIGQFYIATVMAILVGKFLTRDTEN